MRSPSAVVGRLADVTWTARTGVGRRALLRWRPRSLAAYRLASGVGAAGVAPATVLDVGANAGQFARAATELLDRPRVISFEPLPSAAAEFRANLADASSVVLHQIALGASEGTAQLHQHPYSLASSLRPLRPGGRTPRWAAEEPTTIDVAVRRLDDVLSDSDIARPCLLKIDVQGTELDVLAGASRTLESVDWILLELSFDAVYDGEPLFDEVDAALRAAGWRLRWPVATLAAEDGSHVAQFDGLYERCDERPGP